MEVKTVKRSKKHFVMIGLAMLLIISLLLGGTYAWKDFNQHKTNAAQGTIGTYDVTLNDAYTPPDNWTIGQRVDKFVSVTNLKESESSVFVRLAFKEYLETFGSKGYLTGDDGNPILFATYATNDQGKQGEFMTYADAQSLGYDYGSYTVDDVTYATTKTEELRDGIYGKPMKAKGEPVVWGNIPKSELLHELQHTDECEYEAYLWDQQGITNPDGKPIREVIQLIQPTPGVMMMDQWKENPVTGDFWVLDPADGWAYWANALEPGTTTLNLLEAIALNESPGEKFEYYLHIDLQAVSADELNNFETGSNGDLLDQLGGSEKENFEATDITITSGDIEELAVGASSTVQAVLTPENSTSEITWSSSDQTVAEVNAAGVVTGVAPGTAVITAAANGKTDSITVTVRSPRISGMEDVTGTPGEEFTAGGYTWVVLKTEDNNLLVTTKDAIAYVKFNDNTSDGNTYGGSKLDQYLRNDFFTALPQDFQDIVQPAEFPLEAAYNEAATDAVSFVSEAGEKTAFALSISDLNTSFMTTNDLRKAVYTGTTTAAAYWLRTPGNASTQASHVRLDGGYNNHSVNDSGGVVRPALWIVLA